MTTQIENRTANLTEWFEFRNKRPLLGFYLDSQYPYHCYRGSTRHIPDGIVNPEDIIPDDFIEDWDRLYKLYEQAGGDLIWAESPFFGIPWLEASLGLTVIADHKTGSGRTLVPDCFEDHSQIPEFSINNPWIIKLVEFYDTLKKHIGNKYPVGVTHMRGISDLLAAFYSGEKMVLMMYDKPEEIKKTAGKLTDYWISFGKYMMENVPLFMGGTGSFFYSLWCPGKTIWLQEDAAALLSPACYEEFIYPCDLCIDRNFRNKVIHLHPAKFIPADYLLESNINVIEVHMDKGGVKASEMHDVYKKILMKKSLFIWGDLSEEDLDFILETLPAKGLAISTTVKSIDQARKIWNKYTDIYNA